MDFRVHDLTEFTRNPVLAKHVRSSNFVVDKLVGSRPLLARIVQFQTLSLTHVCAPRTHATWTRDELSADRVLLVIVLEGDVSITGDDEIVRRGGQLFLVPGGTSIIELELRAEVNEILYASLSTSLLAELTMPAGETEPLTPAEQAMLVPFISFLASVCRVSTGDAIDASPLLIAAKEVVRAVARMATSGVAEPRSLFTQAMEIILTDFADRALGAASLARRLNVSSRTMQATFQREGITVAAALRDVRARAAMTMRDRNPHLGAGVVASRVGFGSESAMFRALRELRAAPANSAAEILKSSIAKSGEHAIRAQ